MRPLRFWSRGCLVATAGYQVQECPGVVETPSEQFAHRRGVINDVFEWLRIDDLQSQLVLVSEGVLEDSPFFLCLWRYGAQAEEGRLPDRTTYWRPSKSMNVISMPFG